MLIFIRVRFSNFCNFYHEFDLNFVDKSIDETDGMMNAITTRNGKRLRADEQKKGHQIDRIHVNRSCNNLPGQFK